MVTKALGRGLSALISDTNNQQPAAKSGGSNNGLPASSEKQIPNAYLIIEDVIPNNLQPRTHFDQDALNELSESIKENGVIQPIIVRPYQGKYQLVAGERRWRAAKQAGLKDIPAIIKELDDKETLEIGLLENIQRQDLTPIEEADGYKRLQEEYGYTQEEMSTVLGKSRSHIANMLRIRLLPDAVKDMLNKGSLTMGHARALINVENSVELANKIVSKGLSVRQAEEFAAGRVGGKKAPAKTPSSGAAVRKSADYASPADSGGKDEDLLALERALSNNIGLPVTIEDGANGGRVIVQFSNLSELDTILQKFSEK